MIGWEETMSKLYMGDLKRGDYFLRREDIICKVIYTTEEEFIKQKIRVGFAYINIPGRYDCMIHSIYEDSYHNVDPKNTLASYEITLLPDYEKKKQVEKEVDSWLNSK